MVKNISDNKNYVILNFKRVFGEIFPVSCFVFVKTNSEGSDFLFSEIGICRFFAFWENFRCNFFGQKIIFQVGII